MNVGIPILCKHFNSVGIPYVSISFPIVDEGVSAHPFPLWDGVVGAGVDVD